MWRILVPQRDDCRSMEELNSEELHNGTIHRIMLGKSQTVNKIIILRGVLENQDFIVRNYLASI
jgi:hypothetical protein